MNNPTTKLAAFCTTGRLSQEVRQIVICRNVGYKRVTHRDRLNVQWTGQGYSHHTDFVSQSPQRFNTMLHCDKFCTEN